MHLRTDRGSWGVAQHSVTLLSSYGRYIAVYHAYYERVYFSLFNDIFVIQIDNR